jgi:hypothetical protein
MILGRIACLDLLVLFSLGIRAALAGECLISGPRYQLQSDTVEWRMKIRSGQSCLRGVRLKDVAIDTIHLISPPQFGRITLPGWGFSYTAKSDFQGEDSFAVGVSGAIKRVSGTSTIRIVVSIVGTPQTPGLAVPVSRNRPPAPVPARALQASPTPSVDNTAPPSTGASLPPCPVWDWSSGAPPPMPPPFERSKLYCPPPPFNPPGQPLGCICPQ